jgi:hypothetical protein
LSRRYTARLLTKLKLARDVGLLDTDDLSELRPSDFGGRAIGAVIAEPYYYSALLPWDALQLWHAWHTLRPVLSPTATLRPGGARLVVACVEFEHAHRTQLPVSTVCGFSMEPYDAVTIPHNGTVAPMSLWEYEHTVLTDVVTVLAFDFAESPSNAEATVVFPVTRGGAWNGVVSWVVFDDDDDSSHSHRHRHSDNDSANSTKGGCTSAQDPPGHSPKGSSDSVPPWPRGYERPAVQFVPQVIVGADESCAVSLTACFVAATCEVTWHASLVA